MTYTVKQLKRAAYDAGFRGHDLVIAVAVSLAENGSRNERATHKNSNGSYDLGAWQINTVHASILQSGDPFDLSDNARMARAVWREAGQSWSPWVTYKSNAYATHLPVAQSTKINHPDIAHINTHTNAGAGAGSGSGTVSGDQSWIDKYLLTGPGSDNVKNNPDSWSAAVDPLNVTGAVLSWKDGLTKVLNALGDPVFWKRIGIGAGALLLLVVGVILMIESNKSAQSATKVAALL